MTAPTRPQSPMSTKPMPCRDWLKALGVLVASSMTIDDAKERLATFSPLLSREFMPRVFNENSLAFVARRCKFFPTFSELCDGLAAWAKEHPSQVAIAGNSYSKAQARVTCPACLGEGGMHMWTCADPWAAE